VTAGKRSDVDEAFKILEVLVEIRRNLTQSAKQGRGGPESPEVMKWLRQLTVNPGKGGHFTKMHNQTEGVLRDFDRDLSSLASRVVGHEKLKEWVIGHEQRELRSGSLVEGLKADAIASRIVEIRQRLELVTLGPPPGNRPGPWTPLELDTVKILGYALGESMKSVGEDSWRASFCKILKARRPPRMYKWIGDDIEGACDYLRRCMPMAQDVTDEVVAYRAIRKLPSDNASDLPATILMKIGKTRAWSTLHPKGETDSVTHDTFVNEVVAELGIGLPSFRERLRVYRNFESTGEATRQPRR